MGRIEQLVEKYRQHISLPWQQTVAGAQRVIVVIYDKDLERAVVGRKQLFELATRETGHDWFDVNLSDCFAQWMAADEYREAYFDSPDDLQLKLDSEFAEYVAARIRETLEKPEATSTSVVAIFGVGALFGFTRASRILKLIEPYIRGRLVVFFPGVYDQNNYRLLDARDGWNYLAVPITVHSHGGY
jgi:hypothetical protein